MGVKKRRIYYAVHNSDGNCNWDNYAEVKRWGESHGYNSFVKDGKLYLTKKEEIIVYSK